MSLKGVFVSMWWVMIWRVYWTNMMSWSVPRKVSSHFTRRSRNWDGRNKVEGIVVGSAGGEGLFIGGGIGHWDDSPVAAIFLVFDGGDKEKGVEREGGRERNHGLTETRV